MAETRLDGRRALVVGRGGSLDAVLVARLRGSGATVEQVEEGERADPAATATRLGGLDIVVHIAAPSVPVPITDRDDARWAADLAARVATPIRLAREAAAVMARGGGGVLVFVGTLDVAHAYAGHADASVAMGALGGLVRSLAVELAPVGVRADLVLAGPLAPDEDAVAPDPARLERTLLRSPSQRFVTPAEVADAVVFVAGPDAGFMSGSSLRVDAGWASLNQAPDGMRFR